MLRVAMALYDSDVVDETAFFDWRDCVDSEYPGKVYIHHCVVELMACIAVSVWSCVVV
jgi:hypothetical protein